MPDNLGQFPSPFNGPVESGLRSLVLLEAAAPKECDLRRLVVYDYLVVHSGDVPGGPNSLHPATPHRSGELLVRRKMIQGGLILMISRELVAIKFGEEGITYASTGLTKPFLDYLASDYAREIRARASWVVRTFGSYADEELITFALNHLKDWGGELINESLLQEPLT